MKMVVPYIGVVIDVPADSADFYKKKGFKPVTASKEAKKNEEKETKAEA